MVSSDIFYLPDNKRSFRRIMLSNTIDQRFFRPLDNELQFNIDDSTMGDVDPELKRKKELAKKGRPRIMRDPYEFIQFFKQHVYHEIADDYHDFLEDIKILRENHIMIKGHENASAKNFIRLGQKFKQQLSQL